MDFAALDLVALLFGWPVPFMIVEERYEESGREKAAVFISDESLLRSYPLPRGKAVAVSVG